MAPGAVIAALTDLTFNVRGYAAVFANNLLTALFLVMIKRTSSKAGLTTTVPPPCLSSSFSRPDLPATPDPRPSPSRCAPVSCRGLSRNGLRRLRRGCCSTRQR